MTEITNYTIFGSFIWSCIFIALLLIIAFYSEVKENGWTFLGSVIIFCIINYFWGKFPLNELFNWKLIGIYTLIGFIYSIIRTFAKGKEYNRKIKNAPEDRSYGSKQFYRDEKKLFKLQQHIFRWWSMWPISLIVWLLSDLIKDAWNAIYSILEKLYLKIFNL